MRRSISVTLQGYLPLRLHFAPDKQQQQQQQRPTFTLPSVLPKALPS